MNKNKTISIVAVLFFLLTSAVNINTEYSKDNESSLEIAFKNVDYCNPDPPIVFFGKSEGKQNDLPKNNNNQSSGNDTQNPASGIITTQSPFFNDFPSTAKGGKKGGDDEQDSIEVFRYNDTTSTHVVYKIEKKDLCIKYEDADEQLGEDDTIGFIDVFNVTVENGALPVTIEIKSGAGTIFDEITYVGEEIDIYYLK